MTEQTFLTMRETCVRLGVTRQTIFNLVKRGKLKRYERGIGRGIGGANVLFDAQEVAALGEVTPAAVEIGETERKRTMKKSKSKSKRKK